MTSSRALAVVTAGACLAWVLAGCGGDDQRSADPGPGSEPGSGAGAGWPSSATRPDASGLVWASGDTVHLADGSTIAVGDDIDTFVLGGGGVFFTTDGEDGPDYGGYLYSHPLHYADGDGESRTVADAAASPRTSADGRYLVFLDLASGEKDDFGTPQIETVVVDLERGREVARTSEGMGDRGSDDLADLYSESNVGVLGVEDGVAYVDTTDPEVLTIDLATGDTGTSDRSADDFDLPPDDDRTSPDGRWTIVDDPDYRDRLSAVGGRPVALTGAPPQVDLRWWVDDTTAAGIGITGGVSGGQFRPGAYGALVTCRVPSGRCTTVDGTAKEVVHLPEGTLDHNRFLLDGSG